jgi:retron-type reverse transcriptase
MNLNNLITHLNLSLAWRRLTTTKDARYKNFFRHIYEAYELSSEANLKDLRQRLKSCNYTPATPVRIYFPKASGLQRPITLLSLEDQIILQAIANLFADKFRVARQPLIGKAVFSNWLSNTNSPEFFLNDWQYGYKSFKKQLISCFIDGNSWVADFDLSAFYETIPHDLLIKMLVPRGKGTQFHNDIMNWLNTWSSDEKTAQHGHGLPQGPIASGFLAECTMLPIDTRMVTDFRYFRYVDDIRIMGKTELEIQQALVYLDILCRERGLIPNSDKTKITKIKSREELVNGMPEIIGYVESGKSNQIEQAEAESLIADAISEENSSIRILDRSKLRFALFRAPASNKLLNIVLQLWKHSPQHADAYVSFLENYERVEEVINLCDELLRLKFPYDYIRGEMWKLLARMCNSNELFNLRELAIETIKHSKKGSASKIGAYIFFCKCEQKGIGAYSKWLMYENSAIVQSIVSPYLDLRPSRCRFAVKRFLQRNLPDPSLGLTRELIANNVSIDELGMIKEDLHPIVQNVYYNAGIIPSRSRHKTVRNPVEGDH